MEVRLGAAHGPHFRLLTLLAENARPPSLPDLPAPKPPALDLSIDQGEELFLAEGAEEAEKFLSLLKNLLTATTPDVITLVTIRSDSYERLQMAKPLEGVKQDAMSLPVSASHIRTRSSDIVRPASSSPLAEARDRVRSFMGFIPQGARV